MFLQLSLTFSPGQSLSAWVEAPHSGFAPASEWGMVLARGFELGCGLPASVTDCTKRLPRGQQLWNLDQLGQKVLALRQAAERDGVKRLMQEEELR